MSASIIDSYAVIGVGKTWDVPPRWVDYKLETLLARSGEAGISRSCVMALRDPFSASANRQVADFCAKAPDKLIGFAVHDPQREAGQLRPKLIEEVKSMGLKGVSSDGHPTRELLDAVEELKIPVVYYPGFDDYPGPGRAYYMIAAAYPSVNFILPHLGVYRSWQWWGHYEAIDLVKRFSNVYVGTSSVVSRKYLDMAAQDIPAERILFGSFAPVLDPRVEIHSVKLLKLPEASKALILGGNMQRLLGLS
jgi:predicted TIM-barrel fold metal-dependent hydrolase